MAKTIALGILKNLRRDLARAEKASLKAAEARSKLPPGSSRACVTTANARWMRAAEHRDRMLATVQAAERDFAKMERS
jgi:hypothetical protein